MTFRPVAWLLGLVVAASIVVPPVPGSDYLALFLSLLACLTWIVQMALVGHVGVLKTGPVVALLSFLSIVLLAFVVGQYPWYPTDPAPMRAQLGGLALFVVSGGLWLAVGHGVDSVAQLRRLTWLFVALGTMFVAGDVFALPVVGRLSRPDSVGSLFWTWFVAITASQALCNSTASPPARVAWLLSCGLALFRGFGQAFDWVSGWLPPLVALGVVVGVRFPRTTLGLAVLAIAPVLATGVDAFDAVANGESYSIKTRLEALRIAAQVIQPNPWLGFGPANYYHYTKLFSILGWWVRFNSHNNYVDLIAQVGLVGLSAFLWFAGATALLAWRLIRVAPAGFPRAYAVGALAGLLASLVAATLADWIIPFTYNVGIKGFRSSLLFWFGLGGLLALARLAPRQSMPALAARSPA